MAAMLPTSQAAPRPDSSHQRATIAAAAPPRMPIASDTMPRMMKGRNQDAAAVAIPTMPKSIISRQFRVSRRNSAPAVRAVPAASSPARPAPVSEAAPVQAPAKKPDARATPTAQRRPAVFAARPSARDGAGIIAAAAGYGRRAPAGLP